MRVAFVGNDPFVTHGETLTAEQLFDATGGNTGNLAFNYGMATQVATPAPFISLGMPVEEIRHSADILVMPLANQLGPHMDLENQARQLEAIGLPIVGVGLGVQAPSSESVVKLKPGTERWLRTIADHRPGTAPNIGVRGAFTLEQLEARGIGKAAIVTGCPSNFIDFNPRFVSDIGEKLRRRPSRIAVAAGIPFLPKLAKLEASLADLLDDRPGGYIIQHNLKMIWLAKGQIDLLTAEFQELFRSYIRPGLSWEDFKAWCAHHAIAYANAERWMEDLRTYDFVVGTRFHGAMLAIQAGTPAGCITHDSRTVELCETMRIPSRQASTLEGVTRDALIELFPFDGAGYLARRRELCRGYLEIMSGAGIEMKETLYATAGHDAPRPMPATEAEPLLAADRALD